MTASTPPPAPHRTVRWFLALACVGATVVWSVWCWNTLQRLPNPTDRTGIAALAYEGTIPRALDLALEHTENLRQFALLLLGALWALLIAKRGELHIGLGDLPELLMFGSAQILLGLSLFAQWRHGAMIQEFLVSGATFANHIPDFRDPRVAALVSLQTHMLCLGALAAGLALFSTARLKETPPA